MDLPPSIEVDLEKSAGGYKDLQRKDLHYELAEVKMLRYLMYEEHRKQLELMRLVSQFAKGMTARSHNRKVDSGFAEKVSAVIVDQPRRVQIRLAAEHNHGLRPVKRLLPILYPLQLLAVGVSSLDAL